MRCLTTVRSGGRQHEFEQGKQAHELEACEPAIDLLNTAPSITVAFSVA